MTKTECINIFNAMIRGTPVDFKNLVKIFSDYLTENNIENSDKMVNLVVQNPRLLQQAMPKILDFYCMKYKILSVNTVNNYGHLKPILYYDGNAN